MKRKLRILIDQDEVVALTMRKFVETYNSKNNTSFSEDDIKEWDLRKTFPNEPHSLFSLDSFFLNLEPEQGIEELKKLLPIAELYIVTAGESNSHKDKENWISTYMPFIPKENIIFCKKKHMVWGDYLLDDSISNVEQFNKLGSGQAILFNRSHNQQPNDAIRVNSIMEFVELVLKEAKDLVI